MSNSALVARNLQGWASRPNGFNGLPQPVPAPPPAPAPPASGFRFDPINGHRWVLVVDNVSDDELALIKSGSTEVRIIASGQLCFGLAIRFGQPDKSRWFRSAASSYAPPARNEPHGQPVEMDPRFVPDAARKLEITLYPTGSVEPLAIRRLVLSPWPAYRLNELMRASAAATFKIDWLRLQQQQIERYPLSEMPNDHVELVAFLKNEEA